MLDPELPLGADDAEDPHPGVRVVWSLLREEQLRRSAQDHSGAAAIRELAPEEVLLVGEVSIPRSGSSTAEERAIEVREAERRRASFPALREASELEAVI